MYVEYKANERDKPIIGDIISKLNESLEEWYGKGSRLAVVDPEFRSYPNCFMMRYPITTSRGEKKTILVKIRRNPKMDSLWRTVNAEIHMNIPKEYDSLIAVYHWLANANDDFGVIRPLGYIEKYHAIVMEEFPSRTLTTILINQRFSKNGAGMIELIDAAAKTGKWLRYFHQHIHTPEETIFTTEDVLNVVQGYARRLEVYSHGLIKPQTVMDAFSQKLENVQIDSLLFSQTHADMTCDNVLYSEDHKVCIIDIKTRPEPIYSDLGLILTHPETFKAQIFSRGAYLPESLLKDYRAAILTGYFGNASEDEFLVKLYSAIKIVDKWTMYEELMNRYKGIKHLLAIPVGPFVTSYFQNVLKQYLDSIQMSKKNQVFKVATSGDPTVSTSHP
jgi:hypothetical protein